MNKLFNVSVQIGFYDEPYENFLVFAYNKRHAIELVCSTVPKQMGHRFFNAVEIIDDDSMNKHSGFNQYEIDPL